MHFWITCPYRLCCTDHVTCGLQAIEMHLQCHLTEGNQLRCYLCGYHNSKLAMQWRIMR